MKRFHLPISLFVFSSLQNSSFSMQSSLMGPDSHPTLAAHHIGDGFGNCLCALPDINLDGIDDFAIGTPNAVLNGVARGRVDILSGRDSTRLSTLRGQNATGRFGESLLRIRDADGDGIDDLVVGCPGGGLGRFYVYSAATGRLINAVLSTATLDDFGTSLADLGDLDGDGITELAVGAPAANSGEGRVDICSSLGNTGPQWTIRPPVQGTTSFGDRLATAADISQGGFAELLISASSDSASVSNGGAVFLFSPESRRFLNEAGTQAELIRGSVVNAHVGRALATTRDYIAVGAPGVSEVVFLDIVTLQQSHRANLPAGTLAGASIARLDDFDQDGKDDFLIGAPESDRSGKSDCGLVIGYTAVRERVLFSGEGRSARSGLGYSLATIDDVNGDGVGDWIAAAVPTQPTLGYVEVFSGRELLLPRALKVSSLSGSQAARLVFTFPSEVVNGSSYSIVAGTRVEPHRVSPNLVVTVGDHPAVPPMPSSDTGTPTGSGWFISGMNGLVSEGQASMQFRPDLQWSPLRSFYFQAIAMTPSGVVSSNETLSVFWGNGFTPMAAEFTRLRQSDPILLLFRNDVTGASGISPGQLPSGTALQIRSSPAGVFVHSDGRLDFSALPSSFEGRVELDVELVVNGVIAVYTAVASLVGTLEWFWEFQMEYDAEVNSGFSAGVSRARARRVPLDLGLLVVAGELTGCGFNAGRSCPSVFDLGSGSVEIDFQHSCGNGLMPISWIVGTPSVVSVLGRPMYVRSVTLCVSCGGGHCNGNGSVNGGCPSGGSGWFCPVLKPHFGPVPLCQ
jgi:hypothetical protein